jgi:hypothetical protein
MWISTDYEYDTTIFIIFDNNYDGVSRMIGGLHGNIELHFMFEVLVTYGLDLSVAEGYRRIDKIFQFSASCN